MGCPSESQRADCCSLGSDARDLRSAHRLQSPAASWKTSCGPKTANHGLLTGAVGSMLAAILIGLKPDASPVTAGFLGVEPERVFGSVALYNALIAWYCSTVYGVSVRMYRSATSTPLRCSTKNRKALYPAKIACCQSPTLRLHTSR